MAQSQYPARQVRAKTSEVVDYHRDEAQPGKPLYLLIPGGLIALASLALIAWVGYAGWIDGSLSTDRATLFVCLLAPIYVGGVFLFSYGYELYDVPKALRLTAIIVFLTVAAIIIVAVLLSLLGVLGGGKSSSSSSSSKSSSSSDSSGGSVLGGIGDAIGSMVGGTSSSGSSLASSSSGNIGGAIGPIIINPGPPRTVTHEVIREVPVEPPAPQPITCPYCARSYVPAENKFACPNCGAATPQNLLPPDVSGDQASANL